MPPDDFFLHHPRAWKPAPKGMSGCDYIIFLWLIGAAILLAIGAVVYLLVSVFAA